MTGVYGAMAIGWIVALGLWWWTRMAADALEARRRHEQTFFALVEAVLDRDPAPPRQARVVLHSLVVLLEDPKAFRLLRRVVPGRKAGQVLTENPECTDSQPLARALDCCPDVVEAGIHALLAVSYRAPWRGAAVRAALMEAAHPAPATARAQPADRAPLATVFAAAFRTAGLPVPDDWGNGTGPSSGLGVAASA